MSAGPHDIPSVPSPGGSEKTLRLGAWLLSRGKITEEQLTRSLQDQAFYGGRLGTSLIKLGFIDEDVLGEYLSYVTGIRYAPWTRLESVPAAVIATVPVRLAAQYRIIPIGIEGRRLHLAMRDPRDLIALDEIAFLTGLAIEPYVATEFRVIQALECHYQVKIPAKTTIPVAGGVPEPAAPKTTPATPAGRSRERQVGLDGRPLDAPPPDAAEITAPPPPPAPKGPPPPLPTSMAAWREAQEDIPDTLPEPLRAVPTPVAAPRPPAGETASPPGTPITGSMRRAAGRETMPVPAPFVPAPNVKAHTIEGLSERLRGAETRDEIFDALLEFSSAHFRRSALFVVQQGRVLGWSGRGDDLDPGRIRNVTVGFDLPSLFIFFRTGGDYYFGPVPDLPANARFYRDLGCPPPARVLLMPLKIKNRPAVILYADNHNDPTGSPDVPQLRRALHKASLALEILILKSKIMML